MLTVNSPFFEMNSLVPSSGSTRKNLSDTSGMRPAEAASSEITGTLPSIFARPARMIFSAASSASVTGVRSPLALAEKSVA